MQKILITNDDGIQSDGIIRLARAAKKYGKVWVVAPDGQRSAMSHRITLRETIEFFPVDFPVEGVHAYASTGTPKNTFPCMLSALFGSTFPVVPVIPTAISV